MSFPVEITVRGMGGVINFEMMLLEKTLKEAGYSVKVINDAADWVCSNEPGFFEKAAKNVKESKEGTHEVILTANHIPWGG